MSLGKKVKTALDETRLLILGAQVLFGFQLNGVFQDAFGELSAAARLVNCAGQILMVLAIGLLIAPSMQHRLVEEGEDTARIQQATGVFAGLALVPFQISLGLSVYVVFDHLNGTSAGIVAGILFCLVAGIFWFGLPLALKSWTGIKSMQPQHEPTPLATKIDQMLTEARVILPGVQALLGFQLTVTLTHSFEQLPAGPRLLHVAALCSVALAAILLMTPAALHRIAFSGEDAPLFFRLGSWFVTAAPVPLAIGIAGDLYVAILKASESAKLATVLGLVALVVLAGLWYALPLALRARRAS
jgi:Family of unknown function (DUF6328)